MVVQSFTTCWNQPWDYKMGESWCAICTKKSSVVICWCIQMVCAYFSSDLTATSWIILSYEVAKKVVPSWKWKEQQGRRSSKSKVVTTDCRLDPGSPEYPIKHRSVPMTKNRQKVWQIILFLSAFFTTFTLSSYQNWGFILTTTTKNVSADSRLRTYFHPHVPVPGHK